MHTSINAHRHPPTRHNQHQQCQCVSHRQVIPQHIETDNDNDTTCHVTTSVGDETSWARDAYASRAPAWGTFFYTIFSSFSTNQQHSSLCHTSPRHQYQQWRGTHDRTPHRPSPCWWSFFRYHWITTTHNLPPLACKCDVGVASFYFYFCAATSQLRHHDDASTREY